ncbi:hypothetical protein RFEPED_1165 [Rickettsia felis str. Pedreira]|uniref:Uncharacterized protein n=1 Tax=Rickettsia felis str. Pedreira TaxID=1359196 RepID=A0A0F3MTK0_RICFI|nr:hypothetical protein RFEPED_1165 [Rickettsia felis str. Pedreira]
MCISKNVNIDKVEGIIIDPPNPSKARHNTNPHELSNTID